MQYVFLGALAFPLLMLFDWVSLHGRARLKNLTFLIGGMAFVIGMYGAVRAGPLLPIPLPLSIIGWAMTLVFAILLCGDVRRRVNILYHGEPLFCNTSADIGVADIGVRLSFYTSPVLAKRIASRRHEDRGGPLTRSTPGSRTAAPPCRRLRAALRR